MASVGMRACPSKETREEDMAFILEESAVLKFFIGPVQAMVHSVKVVLLLLLFL